MKRSPMPPRSKPMKRVAMKAGRKGLTDEQRAIRQAVFDRDGHCQLRGVEGAGPCFGPLTPHHKRKASQGGKYTLDELVALCSHHNSQIEADADLARLAHSLGLVVRRGDRPTIDDTHKENP